MEIALTPLSLLPSLTAIILALLTRQVFIALFAGVWIGVWILEGLTLSAAGTSIFSVVDTYLIHAIVPENGSYEHFSIVLFSLMTGAMIGVVSRNGGMQGVVNHFSRVANTQRKGQIATFGLGGLIFFDDYANTLIVGNTMRPLMDALKVSREKLAFLVDSTAAPIACIALVTTWVGFQVSLMQDSLKTMQLEDQVNGFEIVLSAIPYSFYPLMMLWFIAVSIYMQRDFGPMLKAERAALKEELPKDERLSHPETEVFIHKAEPLALNGVLPIFAYIGVTIIGLWQTGTGDNIRDILGSADPFQSVLWGATAGVMMAIFLSLVTKRLSMSQTMEAVEIGLRPMILAMMILTFAWAIADVNTQLKTAEYIVSVIGEGLNPFWLPVIVFLIAAMTSFATGSSWGTMGILVPLVMPLAYAVVATGYPDNIPPSVVVFHPVMLASVASVLTGAVWGDHCSPISDTTILSSMASSCNHMEHVRTQMPYAIVIALVSIAGGLIPVSLGMPWWGSMLLCMIIIVLILRFIGQPVHATDIK